LKNLGKSPITETEKMWLQKLRDTFDSWLNKMPDAPEKVLLRWDNASHWQQWKSIDLDWYTSVANNIDDTFIARKDSLIEIEVIPWKAKDISDLASYKHFAKEMWQLDYATTHEWIILRGSQAVVESIESNYLVTFRWENYMKNRIIVKQTK
jgi:hypothetical protein